jgi:bifunctional non-homologous end joining protein LigD
VAPSLIPKKPFGDGQMPLKCRRRAPTVSDRPGIERVHWVRPELVAKVKYLTWTDDNLLRQVVYEDLRDAKPAAEVRRAVPYSKPAEPKRPAARAKWRPVG